MTPDEKRKMIFELTAQIIAGRVTSERIPHPASYISNDFKAIFEALAAEWDKSYVKNLR
ncbi:MULTISPECIES: hypothetical protein [Enterobacter]|uniref:hypothetical protein n=1 Tax=Enterobacter TaxID=547 RepID=UPI0012B9F274|nr:MULTISPECIES: hypothetical protein [Enterobacter]ELR9202713.1 hypothetical protein [Enterobacter cloacae]MCM7489181.1 hypothetical protein [Enterobacter kobei]MDX7665837.1 hypothetical protein [Enterobacter cloacae]